MKEKAYLSFYDHHGIIPVSQDIGDLRLHFARRRALYKHLGLLPKTIENRTVLEFGPGTADNALYVASCRPALNVLVDGNPASIRAVHEKIDRGLLPREGTECIAAEIGAYTDPRRFDVVLCEGVIPLQENPSAFLSHVASFVAPGGLLVMTTMSPASVLAESCRRLLKPIFKSRYSEPEALLNALVEFFKSDLQSLPGMSRYPRDWVLDNILYPWPARCTFSIPEAIDTLDKRFDVVGTSPSFVQDWRWYKSIPQHPQTVNELVVDAYRSWGAYLIDYRIEPAGPLSLSTLDLDRPCQQAIAVQAAVSEKGALDRIPEFLNTINAIAETLRSELPSTATAIDDFAVGFEQLMHARQTPDFGSFRRWFGRGQQYVSFIKNPVEAAS